MKILILTGSFGMGHLSAARTLADQLTDRRDVERAEVFDVYAAGFSKSWTAICRSYEKLVSKGSSLFNLAYRHAVGSERTEEQDDGLFQRRLLQALDLKLQELQPDVVISTYSPAARLMADYKRLHRCQTPLLTCITDVTSHNVWVNRETALYLVAAEETKQSLLHRGVAAPQICVTGIPVSRAFKPVQNRDSERRELLIMGGGLGLLPHGTGFYRALNQLPGVHTTILTGNNAALRRRLEGRWDKITVLGYTDQVAAHMAQADLLLSKPGGVSMFEAIHAGLPLLTFQPFLEQEVHNARFLEANGLGIVCREKPRDAVPLIAQLLEDKARLAQVRKRMERFTASLDTDALNRYLDGLTKRRAA